MNLKQKPVDLLKADCPSGYSIGAAKERHTDIIMPPFVSDQVLLAHECLRKLLTDYDFHSVLDIGCGEGLHSDIFLQNGKIVFSLDYGKSPYLMRREDRKNIIIGDFMKYRFGSQTFDAVWCSHVLEHQPDSHQFLLRVHSVLRENGVLAVTIPPLKHDIVGGHVSLWNAGLLLYHLVLAGFDCRHAAVKKHGYNISVIVVKRSIDIMSELVFDSGDIRTIQPYLPDGISYRDSLADVQFNGDIDELNW